MQKRLLNAQLLSLFSWRLTLFSCLLWESHLRVTPESHTWVTPEIHIWVTPESYTWESTLSHTWESHLRVTPESHTWESHVTLGQVNQYSICTLFRLRIFQVMYFSSSTEQWASLCCNHKEPFLPEVSRKTQRNLENENRKRDGRIR